MTAFKLTIIGAGSVGFTKKLCADLLKVPEFEDIEIALTDITPTTSTWSRRSCAGWWR